MVTYNPSEGYSSSTTQSAPASDRHLVHDPDMERPATHIGPAHSHVCWGAVIAGTLGAMSLLMLSASLAYACDVSAYRGGTLGAGAVIWTLVTSIVAYFCGGAMVSYFASRAEQRTGLMHGLMAWVLSLPLTLVLSGSAAGLLHFPAAANDILRTSVINQPGSNVTLAAWTVFISLLLGLISSAVGGMVGLNMKSSKSLHFSS